MGGFQENICFLNMVKGKPKNKLWQRMIFQDRQKDNQLRGTCFQVENENKSC